MNTLDLTEHQLEKCVGKNIRITVRKIMKLKYPFPSVDFKFSDVDPSYISAAKGKTSFLYSYKHTWI